MENSKGSIFTAFFTILARNLSKWNGTKLELLLGNFFNRLYLPTTPSMRARKREKER